MTKLDFMMANINGTGTKLIATIDDNAQAFRFIEKSGKVYILYVGTADVEINEQKTSTTAIYEVNCDTKEQKLVADNVETVVFDKYANSTSVAYTQKVVTSEGLDGKQVVETEGNNLCQYTVGSEKAVVIKEGVDIENLQYAKFTPVALSGEVVYFNSESKGLATGNAFNKAVGTTVTKLSNSTYTNVLVDNASQDVVYAQVDGYISKITFANGSASIVRLCSETEDIKFEYIHNGYVYYSLVEQYVLNRVSATEELAGSQQAIAGQMRATLWASYDFAEVDGKLYAFYFNDVDGIKFINYLYASIIENGDDEIKYETKRIGLISQNEQKYAIEEGDDKFAVDEFTSAE